MLDKFYFRLLSYEGVEVINPEGGKEDAEEEAQRGRWKDEVTIYISLTLLCVGLDSPILRFCVCC